MYGFDAISAANGWAMAIAGSLIVITGLSVLAFVISQLNRVADFLETGFKKRPDEILPPMKERDKPAPNCPPSFNIAEAKAALAPLAANLGEKFDLKRLYESAAANDLPHVHLSIRSLRESNNIVPATEGLFRWQN